MKNIKMLILDVDGVLTDGNIILDNKKNELKNFNVKDGLGLLIIQKIGIKVSIITGKNSNIVNDRLNQLGITEIHQGKKNKISSFNYIKNKYNINNEDIAYMGDDLPDLFIINQVGVSACPLDAVSIIKKQVNFISNYKGGKGAVREFCDYIIKEKKLTNQINDDYINHGEILYKQDN